MTNSRDPLKDDGKEIRAGGSFRSLNIAATFKTTILKVAPVFKIGSLVTFRTVAASAAILGGGTFIATEATGATDVLTDSPPAVEITIIADESGAVTIATDAGVQRVSIFDLIRDDIANLETEVTVTVAPLSPEVIQTLTQIGTILDGLPARFVEVNAGILRVDARVDLGVNAIIARLALLEAAVFPPLDRPPER